MTDTDRAAFPPTRGSVVAALGETDPGRRRAAFDSLVAIYWRPVYTRLRLKWGAQPADAEDLTQDFFARAIEGDVLRSYDPARARFRTFLRSCLDHFAANARRAERRLKRGGGAVVLPLDVAAVERELSALDPRAADADAWFDREWVRSLFSEAVNALRESTEGTAREIRFRIFQRHDLAPAREDGRSSYQAIARELGVSVSQVTNHLAWSRRELRRLVLERLAVLCGSDAELRDEAEAILGRPPA